jgi:hypothetical protein
MRSYDQLQHMMPEDNANVSMLGEIVIRAIPVTSPPEMRQLSTEIRISGADGLGSGRKSAFRRSCGEPTAPDRAAHQ